MIDSIKGTIKQIQPFYLLIELNNGLGFGVNVPLDVSDFAHSLGEGKEILLVTRTIYLEKERRLYGFLNANQLEAFDLLRSMHGLGDKISLSILSAIGAQKLANIFETQDISTLIKVPKIGKTKAQKILFEGNNKIEKFKKFATDTTNTSGKTEQVEINILLFEAMEQLGYAKLEIDKAVKKATQNDSTLLKNDNINYWIRTLLRYI